MITDMELKNIQRYSQGQDDIKNAWTEQLVVQTEYSVNKWTQVFIP